MPASTARPRTFPYIWTTWLSKLLTGESSCEWAIWFKAHHQGWTKQPSDFDLARWQIDHTALLADTRHKLQDSGYTVHVEAQNAFRLQGRTATLAGQPDLVVPRNDNILVIDVKTGAERPSHVAQVMTYMYALPRAMDQYHGTHVAGEIHYPNRVQRVPQGGLDQGFYHRLITLIHRVAAPDPPPPAPSGPECRFCELTIDDCPVRVNDAGPTGQGSTDQF